MPSSLPSLKGVKRKELHIAIQGNRIVSALEWCGGQLPTGDRRGWRVNDSTRRVRTPVRK